MVAWPSLKESKDGLTTILRHVVTAAREGQATASEGQTRTDVTFSNNVKNAMSIMQLRLRPCARYIVSHIMIAGTAAQKAGQKAAGVLWRLATDSDKAKLEVAKAGAVAPAVAMLKAACQDLTVSPAATEVRMLLIPCFPSSASLCMCVYIYRYVCARVVSAFERDAYGRDACVRCCTMHNILRSPKHRKSP